VNVAGDDQADRTVHGGSDKAVYAYASEDTAWWAQRLGRDLGAAPFGENLTTRGVDVSASADRRALGDRRRAARGSPVAHAVLQARPADGRSALPARVRAGRPSGAYLAILREGDVGAGDAVEIVHRPITT
jgi:MOSC domain-containing protein YiiM